MIKTAKNLIIRFEKAKLYFADPKVSKDDKERFQPKYDELVKKMEKQGIRYSDILEEYFFKGVNQIVCLESDVVYLGSEVNMLKGLDRDELKKIHQAKLTFDGTVIERKEGDASDEVEKKN